MSAITCTSSFFFILTDLKIALLWRDPYFNQWDYPLALLVIHDHISK